MYKSEFDDFKSKYTFEHFFQKPNLEKVKCIIIKFGYSKKATKFEKIFHLKFDVPE